MSADDFHELLPSDDFHELLPSDDFHELLSSDDFHELLPSVLTSLVLSMLLLQSAACYIVCSMLLHVLYTHCAVVAVFTAINS